MMMLVMMMPNVNVWGTQKEYYIARKHVFVFKVSLFYLFFIFYFFKNIDERE